MTTSGFLMSSQIVLKLTTKFTYTSLSFQQIKMASSEDNDKITADNQLSPPNESSKLLSDPLSKHYNGPSSQANSSTSNKPMLTRQDRTYLASPQLSATGMHLGGSEESADDFRIDENNRSAPEMLQDWNTPKISISSDAYDAYNDENAQALSPLPTTRCRTCRRSSTSPTSIVYFDRSTSKENIVHGHLRPHLFVHHHSTPIPPVFVTGGSPSRSSRIIRQSSQPEPSALCGSHCTHAHQSSSLRQLKSVDPSDASLSGIAADALRVSLLKLYFPITS
jgi:hypothetical protein